MNNRISEIRKYGKTARGKKELIKHLEGGRLTFKQAIYAKCYDCMNYFSDGKIDCKIPSCPLFPFMPYRLDREKRNTKKTMPVDNVHTGTAIS
jgi:hypothetical protein